MKLSKQTHDTYRQAHISYAGVRADGCVSVGITYADSAMASGINLVRIVMTKQEFQELAGKVNDDTKS